MLSVDIEKEIKQENKILLGLSMRKFICVLISLLMAILFALLFSMNFYVSIIPSMVVGAIAFAFGWIKFDGVPMEEFLFKKINEAFYGTKKRTYRTKNAYVTLLNKEYARRKQIDLANKQVRKNLKKQKKSKVKENYIR
ncbi:MAG: PrgI family protein [Butyrivibrio sp.]|nr:PrgI family protein [Butyrivibrio sp.]